MKIYDISQELIGSSVYAGDPSPSIALVSSIERGDLYNLTTLSLCAHNGTHIDAPRHFIADGTDVAGIPLDRTVGYAAVVSADGDISATCAEAIIARAFLMHAEAEKRILIKGNATVTLAAAEVFINAGVYLIGTESQSVGPMDSPMAVHLALLKKEVVLLEGIRLGTVPDGAYLLAAQPINIAGADGSPCRAILIEM